jgi:hypothetical protein
MTSTYYSLVILLFFFFIDPVLLLERAAAPFFGIKNYGVHINGYIKDPVTNEIFLWVAKRSPTKSTYPGNFDLFE